MFTATLKIAILRVLSAQKKTPLRSYLSIYREKDAVAQILSSAAQSTVLYSTQAKTIILYLSFSLDKPSSATATDTATLLVKLL